MRKAYFASLTLAALLLAVGAWAGAVSIPVTATVVSADGATITPPTGATANRADAAGSGRITTAEGVWTFGTPANASGDYPLLLNGSNANGGFAAMLQVTNGNLYARVKAGVYWIRWSGAWINAGATAPVEGAVAAKVILNPQTAKVPDDAPAGTIVATATVAMSPSGAAFTGPLVSSNPDFAIQGMKVVTARAFTAADTGTVKTAKITALQ